MKFIDLLVRGRIECPGADSQAYRQDTTIRQGILPSLPHKPTGLATSGYPAGLDWDAERLPDDLGW